MKTLSIPKPLKPEPASDPLFEGASEGVRAAVRDLQERGIIDAKGRRIRQDLPEDMREGADRDFGG